MLSSPIPPRDALRVRGIELAASGSKVNDPRPMQSHHRAMGDQGNPASPKSANLTGAVAVSAAVVRRPTSLAGPYLTRSDPLNRRKIVRISAEKPELIELLEIVISFAPQSSDCADRNRFIH